MALCWEHLSFGVCQAAFLLCISILNYIWVACSGSCEQLASMLIHWCLGLMQHLTLVLVDHTGLLSPTRWHKNSKWKGCRHVSYWMCICQADENFFSWGIDIIPFRPMTSKVIWGMLTMKFKYCYHNWNSRNYFFWKVICFQKNIFQMLKISLQLNPSPEGVLNAKKKNILEICSHPDMKRKRKKITY